MTKEEQAQEQKDKWTALVRKVGDVHLVRLEQATKVAVSNWLHNVASNEERISEYVRRELSKVVQAIIVTQLGGVHFSDYRATSIFTLVGKELDAFLKEKPQQKMLKALIAEVLPAYMETNKDSLKRIINEVVGKHMYNSVRYRTEEILTSKLSSEFSGLNLVDQLISEALKEQAVLLDIARENDDE